MKVNVLQAMLKLIAVHTAALLLWFAVSVHSACVHSNGKVDYRGTFTGTVLSGASLADCPRDVSEIDLGNNDIQSIDNDTFSEFYNLQILRLDNNQIGDLPDGMLSFKWSFNTLDASYNNLTELRDDLFRDNPDLVTLILNHNNISNIGINVFHSDLTKLILANLSYNSLPAFEPWPFITNSDQTDEEDFLFDLRHNKIKEFKNRMNWTNNLREPYEYEIFLQNNEISNMSVDILYLYHPSYSGDVLTEFISYEWNLTVNPFYCDCNAYPFVRDLHNSFFLYYRVEEYRYRCAGPADLAGEDFFHDVELDKFVCHVTESCPQGCSCIQKPYIKQLLVNCTSAGLTSLPEVLPDPMDADGLISLILDYNHITTFPMRNYTSKLLNVSMAYNQLQYIEPSALSAMKNIKSFNISHNRLKFVPRDIQILAFEDIRVASNPFRCDCNMTWMADWVNLSPAAPDYSISCTDDDDRHLIREVTDTLLVCSYTGIAIAVSITLGAVIAAIIGIGITAKRCPYETKVLLYKFFKIHPGDKYKVDGEENREFDIYISYDVENIQARQWVKTVFLKKMEEGQKRKYKVFTPQRDAMPSNPYCDELIDNMVKSRRILFLLTHEFFENEWNCFETAQAEMEHHSSDNLHGRVIYILWNKTIRSRLKEDPWSARMEGKRVLCPDDRFFWSKMRYELPLKPLS